MKNRTRVGVLFGGRSSEHEVSLQSAKAIISALDRDRYEVIPIGVSRQGVWFQMPDTTFGLESLLDSGAGEAVTMSPAPGEHLLVPIGAPAEGRVAAQIDVIFPIIHGPMGEDGTLQGLFELADVPYVGAGVLGSAVGMDKAFMKILFQSRGLPVADYCVVMRKQWHADPLRAQHDIEAQFPYPWFVKPANMGSSVGVSKVHDAGEFAAAMTLAACYDRKIVVEKAIENAREVEVAVLGNDEPRASVPGEIMPSNEFYDYSAKYIDGKSGLSIPAHLSSSVTERLQTLAIEAFSAIDCAGMARVDFLLQNDGETIFVLEANTLPGFTPISMYPKLWEASGLSYTKLVQCLIDLAFERHQDRARNSTNVSAV